MDGLILVDKPQGLTSHGVVARIRKILDLPRVGHFGTLDPLATGLLLIGVGTATRLFPVFSKEEKVYAGRIRLGLATDTYDALGRFMTAENIDLPGQKDLLQAMAKFVGKIEQVPPPYSAKKKDGKPLYQWARSKKPVELKPHLVTIHYFKMTDYIPPHVSFEVKCSSGTYIRSLAHDLGQSLGCGAHLASLRRTEAGTFRVNSAFSLEQVEKLTARGNFQEFLIPLESLFQQWPKAVLSSKGKGMVQKGKAIPSENILRIFETEPGETMFLEGEPIFRVFSLEGKFLALALRQKEKQDLVAYLVLG
jgi:tRNA pseudouridine55 synthase